jgi:sec-independent protein translocase protein TatA
MPFGFHGLDLVVILVIALLIFGPKKLPEMGASIGKSIKEFRKGMSELSAPKNDDDDDEAKLPVSAKDMNKLKSSAATHEVVTETTQAEASSTEAKVE